MTIPRMFTRTSRLREKEREFERERQRWERERHELLDRIMHMAAKTWTPPPEAPPRQLEEEDFLDETAEGSLIGGNGFLWEP